jgi:hypothetical protein
MSALGQNQTLHAKISMSALPPKVDIRPGGIDVRLVQKADIYWFAALKVCLIQQVGFVLDTIITRRLSH